MFNACKSAGSTEYSAIPMEEGGNASLQFLPPLRPLNESEALVARRKCKRCQQYYTHMDSSCTCFYHPGEYREATPRSGTLVGWSCCAVEGFSDEYQLNSIIRKEALQRDCKGCKSLPRHQEDEQYARAVGIFPFDANAAAIQQRDATLSAVAHMAISSGKSKTPVPDVVNKDYILHTLTSADTLQGLALRYGVTILAIKRSNNMISDTFSHLSKIVIPTTGNVKNSPLLTQDPKLEAMRQFKRQTNSSTEEAKFYLEDVDYDVAKAVREFQADMAWEKKNTSAR